MSETEYLFQALEDEGIIGEQFMQLQVRRPVAYARRCSGGEGRGTGTEPPPPAGEGGWGARREFLLISPRIESRGAT